MTTVTIKKIGKVIVTKLRIKYIPFGKQECMPGARNTVSIRTMRKRKEMTAEPKISNMSTVLSGE